MTKIILPVRRGKTMDRILFAVDMSGSMPEHIVKESYNEIEDIWREFRNVDIEFLAFDSSVQETFTLGPADFPLKDDRKRRYCSGGTRFQPVFNYAAEDKNIRGIIMFTDLFAFDKYKKPEVPVIWLVYKEPEYPEEALKRFIPEFGEVTWLYPDEIECGEECLGDY